jgi:hypothetical protein
MNTEKGPYKCLANHRQHTRARLHRGAKIVILQCDVTCLIFSCQAKLNISSKQNLLKDVMLAFLFTVFVNNLLSIVLIYFLLRCTHGNCLEIEIRRIRVVAILLYEMKSRVFPAILTNGIMVDSLRAVS